MGLDMYLTGKRWLSTYKHSGEEANKIANGVLEAAKLAHIAEPNNTVEVEATAIYWRKANAIHKWFVDNVQDGVDDCQERHVTQEQLAELRRVCREVAADWSKAEDLLPTQGGFFFGSTEYGEWYQHDVKETADKLTRLLESDIDGIEFYYASSW